MLSPDEIMSLLRAKATKFARPQRSQARSLGAEQHYDIGAVGKLRSASTPRKEAGSVLDVNALSRFHVGGIAISPSP